MELKNKYYLVIFFFLTFFAFTGSDETVTKQLNEEITLKPGEKAVIDDTDLEITFIRVLEDSRCPRGAECVWQGNGRIELSVYQKDTGRKVIELNTTLEPKQTEIGNFKIHLSKLRPYPEINTEIPSQEYKICLTVENE